MPQVPKSTSMMTRWAFKNLHDWFKNYNVRNPENHCPEDVLSPGCKPEPLNKWLSVFITEIRTKDGSPYPPRSIHSLLTGIL